MSQTDILIRSCHRKEPGSPRVHLAEHLPVCLVSRAFDILALDEFMDIIILHGVNADAMQLNHRDCVFLAANIPAETSSTLPRLVSS